MQVSCIIQCTAYGTGQAAQPIISTNFGAGEQNRVKETNRYGVMTATLFGTVWTALVLLMPNAFIKLYMTPTENVLAIAPAIMRLYGISYLFLPFNIYSTYYFQSVMRSRTAVAVSLLRGLFLCSVLVYFMPAVFGRNALWLVMVVTEFIIVIFAVISMRKK